MPQQAKYDLSILEPLLAQGAVVLTPNLRLSRSIKAAWNSRQAERGLRSWPAVQVYSMESYLEQRWRQEVAQDVVAPRRILGNLSMRELWQKVIERDQASHGGYHLLQADGAAALAQQGRENLLRARVDIDQPAIRAQFKSDPDCACYLRWLQSCNRELAALQAGSLSDALVDLLAANAVQQRDRVLLLDFDDVPALYRETLAKLCESQRDLSGSASVIDPQVHAFADRASELDAVAQAAALHFREAPERSFGIVLSDMHADRAAMEYALRREFDCLGANYTALPVNFSTGISLDRAPVVRDALALMELCGGSIEFDVLLMLLRSRFIALDDTADSHLVKLVQQLARDGAADIDVGRLRYLAQEVEIGGERGTALGVALRQVDELRLQRLQQSPSAWVDSFTAVLACWQWPGSGALDSIEYQQVERWHDVLDAFAAFDEFSGRIGLGQALALLRRCCQDQISQPQTPDSPIQVLGPLEGAGLQFDTLWLAGFQGNRWPAPARPNPFLPVSLQRERRMPHCRPEREWEYASGLLQQYRGACTALHVSYAVEMDGVPELPSALLEGFAVNASDSAAAVSEDWLRRQSDATREPSADNLAPPPGKDELSEITGGSSILQNQAACPFRAFARHRLQLQPLDEPVLGLSAADRGSLLHNALYILWGEIENSDSLHRMGDAERMLAAERASATAVAELSAARRQLAGVHCLDLEQQRLAQLLAEWLETEVAREPFVVSERESSLEVNLAGIPFHLRVDRIDTLAGGERLVIDYKSGRNGLSDWLGERMRQPQLPLYGVASGVDAVSFAQVRARDSKFVGLGAVDGVPGVKDDVAAAIKRWDDSIADWPALVEHWRAGLDGLAQAFVAGEAFVDPLQNACNFCGLQPVCRVQLQEEGA